MSKTWSLDSTGPEINFFSIFFPGGRSIESPEAEPVRRRSEAPRRRPPETAKGSRGGTLLAGAADLAVGEALQGGRDRDPGGSEAAAGVQLHDADAFTDVDADADICHAIAGRDAAPVPGIQPR